MAERARSALAPLAIVGLPESGTYAVARAIHRDGEAAGFVSLRTLIESPRDLIDRILVELEGDPAAEVVTLYVESPDRQARGIQEAIVRLIDEGIRFRSRSVPVRVVAQLAADPRAGGRFANPLLASRLATLVLPVRPIGTRAEGLQTIVPAVSADLVTRLGLGARWLSPEGARHLADRDWPGDFAELETTITRILLSARGSVVTLEDVLAALGPAPSGARAAVASPASPPAPPARGSDESRLETIVMELAHELKNPMVTIKTFAGHLDRMLDDATTREKFVQLTGEAIERMDGFLEDLLAFSRFGEPRPQVLLLAPLVQRAFSTPELSRDRISGNGVPPGVSIVADEEQTEFALRALLRGLCKRLSPEAPIVYQWIAPGGLQFDSRGEPTALHNIMGQGNRDELSASLDFFVSRSLIERNRGRLVANRDESGLHVRLELPLGGPR